jgi:protein AroM
MKQRVGMITVGQSPRDDIVPSMLPVLGSNIEVIEKGALDGLSGEEIQSLAPKGEESRFCTRLSSGQQVVLGKEMVIPLVQEKIHELNEVSVDLIVLLCTGHFPRFKSRCLVLEAEKVVDRCVDAVVDDRHTLGVAVPLPEQIKQAKEKLSEITPKLHVVSASPYGPPDEIRQAAEILCEKRVDLVVLHCMGFSADHRKMVREVTRKPVLVANAIVARTVAELLAT